MQSLPHRLARVVKPLRHNGGHARQRFFRPGGVGRWKDDAAYKRDRGDHQWRHQTADDAREHAEKEPRAVGPGQTPDFEQEFYHSTPLLLAVGRRKREFFCGYADGVPMRFAPLKAIRLYRHRRVIYWFAHHVLESRRPSSARPVFYDVLKRAEDAGRKETRLGDKAGSR